MVIALVIILLYRMQITCRAVISTGIESCLFFTQKTSKTLALSVPVNTFRYILYSVILQISKHQADGHQY